MGTPRWKIAVCALLVAPIVIGVPYAAILWDRIERVDVDVTGSPSGGTTYLLIGSDSRAFVSNLSERKTYGTPDDVPGARADLILAIRVPEDGGPPKLMSVPRDLLVLDDELGLSRIALSYLGGPQGLIDSLCRNLGLGVDHLAILDFGGFVDLVDDIGGIDVQIDKPLWDPQVELWMLPGLLRIDGRSTLLYLRARHLLEYDGTNWVPHDAADDRGARARVVLQAFAHRASLSPLDPLKVHRLLWGTSEALTIDDSASLFDLEGLGNALRAVGGAHELRLPVASHSGAIPWAELQVGAAEVLAPFVGPGSHCRAALPAARQD